MSFAEFSPNKSIIFEIVSIMSVFAFKFPQVMELNCKFNEK